MADSLSDANLYAMSTLILRSFPTCFVKVDPHDPKDPDHVDMLWFEYGEDEYGNEEGELLTVGLLIPGGSLWSVSYESAMETGGWPTHWSMTGDAQAVLAGIREALQEDLERFRRPVLKHCPESL